MQFHLQISSRHLIGLSHQHRWLVHSWWPES